MAVDVAGRAAEHGLGLVPDGEHRVVGLVDGDDGGLVHHDAFAADIDEGVGRAQIDGEVVGEEPGEEAQQHSGALPFGSVDGWTIYYRFSHSSTSVCDQQEDVSFREDGDGGHPSETALYRGVWPPGFNLFNYLTAG